MQLVNAFEKAFNVKYSYKTLIKYVTNNSQLLCENRVEKRKKSKRMYREKNVEKLKLIQKKYYKKFRQRLLAARRKRYYDSLCAREKEYRYGRAYYEKNKRRRCDSLKLYYLRKRPILLLKAKIKRRQGNFASY
jgi:hypothetical protein